MKEKLTNLLNTLSAINTKGEDTLKMADCIRYTAQLIQECDAPPPESTKEDKEVKDDSQ